MLEGKEQYCEFDSVEMVLQIVGRYCCVPVTHKVSLGKIVNLLQEFKAQSDNLMMSKMPDGSFTELILTVDGGGVRQHHSSGHRQGVALR